MLICLLLEWSLDFCKRELFPSEELAKEMREHCLKRECEQECETERLWCERDIEEGNTTEIGCYVSFSLFIFVFFFFSLSLSFSLCLYLWISLSLYVFFASLSLSLSFLTSPLQSLFWFLISLSLSLYIYMLWSYYLGQVWGFLIVTSWATFVFLKRLFVKKHYKNRCFSSFFSKEKETRNF